MFFFKASISQSLKWPTIGEWQKWKCSSPLVSTIGQWIALSEEALSKSVENEGWRLLLWEEDLPSQPVTWCSATCSFPWPLSPGNWWGSAWFLKGGSEPGKLFRRASRTGSTAGRKEKWSQHNRTESASPLSGTVSWKPGPKHSSVMEVWGQQTLSTPASMAFI